MKVTRLHIVCFLIFAVLGSRPAVGDPTEGKDSDLFLRLREEKQMRETAESHIRELEAARSQTERQLNDLRTAFADLYLENQALVAESRDLRLQAGQLVLNGQPAGTNEAAELDRRLHAVLRYCTRAEQQLQELKVHLNTVFEAENSSNALKTLTAARIAGVFDELNHLAEVGNPPQISTTGDSRQATILAVHRDLQLLILDKGSLHGLTAGSNWLINTSQKRPITAQIISLRPRISAAIIRSGNIDDAAPGLEAQRQISEPTRN